MELTSPGAEEHERHGVPRSRRHYETRTYQPSTSMIMALPRLAASRIEPSQIR
jgi:hypothetical protein